MLFTLPSRGGSLDTYLCRLSYRALIVAQHYRRLQLVRQNGRLVRAVHSVNKREDALGGRQRARQPKRHARCLGPGRDRRRVVAPRKFETHRNFDISAVTRSARGRPNIDELSMNFATAQISEKNSRNSGSGQALSMGTHGWGPQPMTFVGRGPPGDPMVTPTPNPPWRPSQRL